jgi:hypothetical protein
MERAGSTSALDFRRALSVLEKQGQAASDEAAGAPSPSRSGLRTISQGGLGGRFGARPRPDSPGSSHLSSSASEATLGAGPRGVGGLGVSTASRGGLTSPHLPSPVATRTAGRTSGGLPTPASPAHHGDDDWEFDGGNGGFDASGGLPGAGPPYQLFAARRHKGARVVPGGGGGAPIARDPALAQLERAVGPTLSGASVDSLPWSQAGDDSYSGGYEGGGRGLGQGLGQGHAFGRASLASSATPQSPILMATQRSGTGVSSGDRRRSRTGTPAARTWGGGGGGGAYDQTESVGSGAPPPSGAYTAEASGSGWQGAGAGDSPGAFGSDLYPYSSIDGELDGIMRNVGSGLVGYPPTSPSPDLSTLGGSYVEGAMGAVSSLGLSATAVLGHKRSADVSFIADK